MLVAWLIKKAERMDAIWLLHTWKKRDMPFSELPLQGKFKNDSDDSRAREDEEEKEEQNLLQ